MDASFVIQACSAGLGLLGSVFFAIGVIRQSPASIAKQSGAYWGFNPHSLKAAASQKVNYVIGFVLLIASFTLQLANLMISDPVTSVNSTKALTADVTMVATLFVAYLLLHIPSRMLTNYFERRIASAMTETKS